MQGTAPEDTGGPASPSQQALEAGAAAEGSPAGAAADQSTADAADEQFGPVEPAASVTFTVPAEQWSHTQDVPLNTTAIDIRRSLCGKWGIGEDALSVRFAGQAMPDKQSLLDCGIQVGGLHPEGAVHPEGARSHQHPLIHCASACSRQNVQLGQSCGAGRGCCCTAILCLVMLHVHAALKYCRCTRSCACQPALRLTV